MDVMLGILFVAVSSRYVVGGNVNGLRLRQRRWALAATSKDLGALAYKMVDAMPGAVYKRSFKG